MYERIIQRQMTPSETLLRIFISLLHSLTNIQRPKKWSSFPILHIRCILCIFAPVNFLQVHKNSWHFLEQYSSRRNFARSIREFAYGRECSGSVYVCAPRLRDARENRLGTTYNRFRCLEARNSIDDQQITNVFHNCRECNT